MATLKHIASVARAVALFNHKPHICDIQFDVVANDLNNRIVIKIRTTPSSKRTSFTNTMRSPESKLWMNKADRSCGDPTCSTPLSVAISRLQQPVCCKAKDENRRKEVSVCWEFQKMRQESYQNITTEEGKLLRCNRSFRQRELSDSSSTTAASSAS